MSSHLNDPSSSNYQAMPPPKSKNIPVAEPKNEPEKKVEKNDKKDKKDKSDKKEKKDKKGDR